MRLMTIIALVVLVSCGGSGSSSSDGSTLQLVGVYDFAEGLSDCSPLIAERTLSLFLSEDETTFQITDANDAIYLEGDVDESLSMVHLATIGDEIAECLFEYDIDLDQLTDFCESESFTCSGVWI